MLKAEGSAGGDDRGKAEGGAVMMEVQCSKLSSLTINLPESFLLFLVKQNPLLPGTKFDQDHDLNSTTNYLLP